MTVVCIYIYNCCSEGVALTGYVVPECMEDGVWMLWQNFSAVVVATVAAVVAKGSDLVPT